MFSITEPRDGARTYLSDELVFPRRRPRRHLFAWMNRNHRSVTVLLISIIVFMSGTPFAPTSTAVAVGLYFTYLGARRLLLRTHGERQLTETGQVIRAIGLVVGTTIFLYFVYWHVEQAPDRPFDALWLLYLLPILLVSRRGLDTTHVSLVAGVALLGMWSVSPWFIGESWTDRAQTLTIKSLWLILIALVVHTLIRVIADRHSDFALLHELYAQTAPVRTADERIVLQKIVDHLAQVFDGDEVNVVEIQADGSFIVGASSAGADRRRLIDDPGWLSVMHKVVKDDVTLCIRDLQNDRSFKPTHTFPDTRSQLALPIRIGSRRIGVMDIQSKYLGSFRSEDVTLCESIAAYTGSLLDNVRLSRSYDQVGQIFTSLARRFVSANEISTTLEQIAMEANHELAADVVIVYERDPLTSAIRWGAKSGELIEPDRIEPGQPGRDSLVERFIASNDPDRFEEAIPVESRGPAEGFVMRERIQSRAMVKLQADSGVVGVMFLNYRKPVRFDDDSKARFRVFASAAAIAIYKAQTQEQQLQWQRVEFKQALHDALKTRAFALAQLIEEVKGAPCLDGQQRNYLDEAHKAAGSICSEVDLLASGRKDLPMTDLRFELTRDVSALETAYRVRINIEWPAYPPHLPSAVIRELKLVANEAMGNAARYGARRIDVIVSTDQRDFRLEFADDGPGFDPGQPREGQGLDNMKQRIERLGGGLALNTALGAGTRIVASVPITALVG